MWHFAGHISIWVEIVAGKLLTITAKFYALFLGAFIGRTTILITEDMLLKRYLAIMLAASFAKHHLNRNVVFR